MTGARVFVTRRLPDAWRAPLAEAGLDVDAAGADDPLTPAELRARAAGAAARWVQLNDTVDAAPLSRPAMAKPNFTIHQ